jgi:hypothetical protein
MPKKKPPAKLPITHLILSITSSNENDNGDCDLCLVATPADYIAYLLGQMAEVARMQQADPQVYGIELWDSSPMYLRSDEKVQTLRDIDGRLVEDVPEGEPALLRGDSAFSDADYQRVECQTVQVCEDEVWWTACVRHTDIRIESARLSRKTLLRIQRNFGGVRPPRQADKAVHPAIRKIHDLLYLDLKDGRESYDPEKSWDPDTIAAIAEVVAEYVPRPPPVEPDDC